MNNMGRWTLCWVLCGLLTVGAVSVAGAEESAEGQGATEDVERFDRLNIEEPTNLARAELAVGQTLHGIVLGFQVCAAIDCGDQPRLVAAFPAVGGGAGLGLSLLATGDSGVTSGQASALNSGAIWGGWIGATSSAIGDVDSDVVPGVMAAGQVTGMAAGYGLSEWLRPTGGDVTMVNHAGIWSGLYYMMITEGIAQIDQDFRVGAAGTLTASVAGGVGGAVLASQYPASSSRVRIVSAGGLLGGLSGLAVPFLAVGENLEARAGITGITLGSAAGLAIATIATSNWDDDEEYRPASASFSVQPSPEGDGALGTISGQW